MLWHYLDPAGIQKGPVSEEELRRLLELGVLKAATLVWRDGLQEWRPVRDVLKLGPPRRLAQGCLLAAAIPGVFLGMLYAEVTAWRVSGALGVALAVLSLLSSAWTLRRGGSTRWLVPSRVLAGSVALAALVGLLAGWAGDRLTAEREADLRAAAAKGSLQELAAAFEDLAAMDHDNPLLLQYRTPDLQSELERRARERARLEANSAEMVRAEAAAREQELRITAQRATHDSAIREIEQKLAKAAPRSYEERGTVRLECEPSELEVGGCRVDFDYYQYPQVGPEASYADIQITWVSVAEAIASDESLSAVTRVQLTTYRPMVNDFGEESWELGFKGSVDRALLKRVRWDNVGGKEFMRLTRDHGEFYLDRTLVPFLPN